MIGRSLQHCSMRFVQSGRGIMICQLAYSNTKRKHILLLVILVLSNSLGGHEVEQSMVGPKGTQAARVAALHS